MMTLSHSHIRLLTTRAVLFTLLLPLSANAHIKQQHSQSIVEERKLTDRNKTNIDIKTQGTRILSADNGLAFKILLEQANTISDSIELAEVSIPAGLSSGRHTHLNNEYIYVIEGELAHTIGDKTVTLLPGDVGLVKRGVEVTHTPLNNAPVKALVLWVTSSNSHTDTINSEIETLNGLNEYKIK